MNANLQAEFSSQDADVPAAHVDTTQRSWKSLFSAKPRNGGKYVSKQFDFVGNGDTVIAPPQPVVDAASEFWSDTLVGFFLDDGHGYSTVRRHVRTKWKVKGSLIVRFDRDMFYFEFSNPDERKRILEADPCFIERKMFIVAKWSPSIDHARDHVLSVPIWAKFSNIPSSLQSLVGLHWLACQIGDLICFDENTECRDRLAFARALIEITPNRSLPSHLSVALSGDRIGRIDIYYQCPPICTTCCSFGHIHSACKVSSYNNDAAPLRAKIPIQKPTPRLWKERPASSPCYASSGTPASAALGDHADTVLSHIVVDPSSGFGDNDVAAVPSDIRVLGDVSVFDPVVVPCESPIPLVNIAAQDSNLPDDLHSEPLTRLKSFIDKGKNIASQPDSPPSLGLAALLAASDQSPHPDDLNDGIEFSCNDVQPRSRAYKS